jgi:hypothetical protein
MIPYFHPSAGDIITGVVLLASVGLNGLLIHLVKEKKQINDGLVDVIDEQAETLVGSKHTIDELTKANATLAANQKPAPWNKGKSGYKLPRRPKEETYVMKPTYGIVAAWDKDGKQTVTPNWEAV